MEKQLQKKVSVIMGIYNCEETLPKAIESIINQTYDNIELVMCDDGSTDNTYNVALYYQSQNPDKIKLVKHETNKFLAASLNDCLKVADGYYIARMDGDDISVLDRIEKQVMFLETNPDIHLVSTAMQMFNENGNANVLTRDDFPDKYSLRNGTCFNHATILTYKYVYEELNGYTVSKRTQRAQDYDLWFRFFNKGFKGANLSEPLYLCREDMSAFKRRTFKSRYYNYKTMIIGYKLLDYPLHWYMTPVKELLKGFVPSGIAYRIRQTESKDRNN